MKYFELLLISSFFICLSHCSSNEQDTNNQLLPDTIRKVLVAAGYNASELRKAIFHYQKSSIDSLKLKAAFFLIENMPGKGYLQYELQDASGRRAQLDLFAVKEKDKIQETIKEYESEHHTTIQYVALGFREDIHFITASQLIENIDLAFEVWHLPWSRHLNFDQFCELILPYRVSFEPLQTWRKDFFNRFNGIRDSIKTEGDILKAVSSINDKLKEKYSYRHGEMDFYRGYLNLEELAKFGGGRCEDLNVVAGYAMRAVGLPISLEFTPYWSNSNYGGHSWLSVLDADNTHVPFNSIYDNPKKGSLPFGQARLAKAFRASFGKKTNFFVNGFPEVSSLPPLFQSKNFYDITAEYLLVSNLSLKLDPTNSNSKVAYLAVLNGKDWKPIQWSKVTQDSVTFQSMAREVIYVPIYYYDQGFDAADNYKIVGDAFFLTIDGIKQDLIPNKADTSKMTFDLSQLPWLIPGRKYSVAYWNGRDWKLDDAKRLLLDSPRTLKVMEKMLEIVGVPNNTMYRVFSDSIKSETELGRMFIYNHKQGRYRDY